MDVELGRALVRAIEANGFDLTVQYGTGDEMRRCVALLDDPEFDGTLDAEMRRGLLENFRAVVVGTMATGLRSSILAVSKRPRWRYLGQASPAAAAGFAAALRMAKLPVPAALGENN
ncbi:MAG: hypothetical protein ACKVT1_03345 [Dehalococcoidia bacterium]